MTQHPQAPAKTRDSERGYTLLEVLVSLAILALLLALLPGMLRVGTRATESARAIESADASEAALSLVRRTIEGALPFYETGAQGQFGIAFHGETSSLELVAELPGGRNGLARYRLGNDLARGGITLAHSRFVPGSRERNAAPFGGTVDILRDHVLGLRYFGRPVRGGPLGWHDRWQSTEALPQLVEVAMDPSAPGGRAYRMNVELRLKP